MATQQMLLCRMAADTPSPMVLEVQHLTDASCIAYCNERSQLLRTSGELQGDGGSEGEY